MKGILSTVPRWRDPRWMQFAILFGYTVAAREVFNFPREHWAVFGCVVSAVVLDLVLGRLRYGKNIFPLSAAVIGLSSSNLIYSPYGLAFVAVASLGVVSKALVTYKGRHIYNPSNFGVVFLLLFFPSSVTGMPHLFSGYWTTTLVFLVLGTINVVYARQWMLSYSWMAGFALFAALRSALFGQVPELAFGPLFTPLFMVYTFHMISDPATTPRSTRNSVLFGFATALVDAVLRLLGVPNGMFFALFAVTSLMPFIVESEKAKVDARIEVGPGLKPA